MFFSDHGKNILDDSSKRYGHGGVVPTKFVLEVPVLAWFSERYINVHAQSYNQFKSNRHNPVSLNGLFDTMMNIYGLLATDSSTNLSFFTKNTKKRTVLTRTGEIINH